MARTEVTKEDLEGLSNGTLFQFETFDDDDNHYWKFCFCKSGKGFIYLGGGIDFGTAVGNIYSIDEILEDANNTDFPELVICSLTRSK